MSLEHLFATSVLSLLVPDTSVQFPPADPPDEWLESLASGSQQRKQVFFDEQLQSLLTLRVEHPTPDPADPSHPPAALVTLLAHVQVSLEASYISPVPSSSVDAPHTGRLSLPLPTASLGNKSSPRGASQHPSILPPNTPNPTPATTDHDRKYVASQGTLLFTSIWGQNTAENTHEEFALLWSERENVWVAIYRLALTVSFLRLTFMDPLLCLTISATLREKPVTTSSTNHPFIRFLKACDGVDIPESPPATDKAPPQDEDDSMNGFEEVNLLGGLLAGSTFAKVASEINVPSTRLGTVSRRKLFSLLPANLPSLGVPSPSPTSSIRGKIHPTLRKSFRKTLETVSGFRVRMRTVFVPSIVLDASQEEHDKVTSGSEERTVVLCVEIENPGESGQGVGFEVEKVDVTISGDEANATLITWGTGNFTNQDNVFPLKVAPWAQYNLLYAVTFLRSPEELNALSFTRKTTNTPNIDLQRAVSINIHGKPYIKAPDSTIIYPTQSFSSKWNCILDLASPQSSNLQNPDPSDPSTTHPNILPEPPSPFPTFSLQTSKPSPVTNLSLASMTPTAKAFAGRVSQPSTPRPTSMPMSASPSRMSLPVQNVPNPHTRLATTYSAPTPPSHPPFDHPHPYERPYSSSGASPARIHTPPLFAAATEPPVTPAYPPFPSSRLNSRPATPKFHAPVLPQASCGVVGPVLEARRRRVSGVANGIGGAVDPSTPLPQQYDTTAGHGTGAGDGLVGNEQRIVMGTPNNGDNVVISVGLLDIVKGGGVGSKKGRHKNGMREQDVSVDDLGDGESTQTQEEGNDRPELGPGKIYPFDSFTLDIFVFNKSERTRRFEISCLERRRRRADRGGDGRDDRNDSGVLGAARKMGYPGIMPMESQVRIGPLLPSACQSVRMEFLAVSPGVHSIEALTLTDIESGYSVNLRSVMDIVVHKPDD